MTWAKLDDTFHHHPKLMEVDLAAVGLFALGLSYATDNLTDGHLPEKWVRGRVVGDDESAPEQLVEIGLWEPEKRGFRIHDYGDYNPSREEVEQKRQKDSERKREGVQPDPVRNPNGKKKESSREPGTGSSSGSVVSGSGTNSGKSPSVSVAREEFADWLEHYRSITGRRDVRGSQPARDSFTARRKDGFSLNELKLATTGCHGDEFCREHKHDVPETILRASKVQRYIQLGKAPAGKGRVAELVERGRRAAA